MSSLLASLVSTLSELPDDQQFVVDGGHLVQSVVWNKPATYYEVCQSYVQYIIRHDKHDAKVIFDGYEQQLSTKRIPVCLLELHRQIS